MRRRAIKQEPVAPLDQPPLWAVVELLDIQLVELRASTNWRSDALPEVAPLLNMTTHATSELIDGMPRLSATVRFCLHSQGCAPERAEESDFFLAATYRVLYEFPKGYVLAESDQRDFENRNIPFNVYPYWRELAHSTCSRMELPVGHLPLFRIKPPTRTADKGTGAPDMPLPPKASRRTTSRETSPRRRKK